MNDNQDTVKIDSSQSNMFDELPRGFKETFDKGYDEFWARRNMEPPNNSWFGERNKRKEKNKDERNTNN